MLWESLLETEGEIFAVHCLVLDSFNSSLDFCPLPNSENPVFAEKIRVKFGFSIANFRAIFEVWRCE